VSIDDKTARYVMGMGLFLSWPLLVWMQSRLPELAGRIDQIIDFVKYGLVTVTGWHLAAWERPDPKPTEPADPAQSAKEAP